MATRPLSTTTIWLQSAALTDPASASACPSVSLCCRYGKRAPGRSSVLAASRSAPSTTTPGTCGRPDQHLYGALPVRQLLLAVWVASGCSWPRRAASESLKLGPRIRPISSMPPAVLVELGSEALGQARPFAVIGIVAPSARCAGRTAAPGIGVFPRAGDMGLANPAGAVAARAAHRTTRSGRGNC